MNRMKRFVLPVQVVLLFAVPAVMLTIVNSIIAVMLMLRGDVGFHEVTASRPMIVVSVFLYLGFLVSVGQWMWEER